jgi:hypothetical protein
MKSYSKLFEAKMTKKQIKEQAQDAIMETAQTAFRSENSQLHKEMDKQFKRIEKLFGYDPGSWNRGG